jgi:hypothetical protein
MLPDELSAEYSYNHSSGSTTQKADTNDDHHSMPETARDWNIYWQFCNILISGCAVLQVRLTCL